jgi:hypothetical protein
VVKTCGFVELVMSADEAQTREEAAGGRVRWVVPGKKRVDPDDPECMVDHTGRRLEGVALPPMTGGDMHAKFGGAWIGSVRSESAAVVSRFISPALSHGNL